MDKKNEDVVTGENITFEEDIDTFLNELDTNNND